MTELILTLNILALTAVIASELLEKRAKGKCEIPKISFKKRKGYMLSEEEKRDFEILESIAGYDGIRVNKREEKI